MYAIVNNKVITPTSTDIANLGTCAKQHETDQFSDKEELRSIINEHT